MNIYIGKISGLCNWIIFPTFPNIFMPLEDNARREIACNLLIDYEQIFLLHSSLVFSFSFVEKQ